MADTTTQGRSRLLVRPDFTAVRLVDTLGQGGRARGPGHTGGEAADVGDGRVQAGRAYPVHGAGGSWLYLPAWQLGAHTDEAGTRVALSIRYWGPGGTPPEDVAGLTGDREQVGELEAFFEPPAPPAAEGPVSVWAPVVPILATLRYETSVAGAPTGVTTERVLGVLRPPLVGPADSPRLRLYVRLWSADDAALLVGALASPTARLALRAQVPVWVRSWNQSVVGGRTDSRVSLGASTKHIARVTSAAEVSKVRLAQPQASAVKRVAVAESVRAVQPVAEVEATSAVAANRGAVVSAVLSTARLGTVITRAVATPAPAEPERASPVRVDLGTTFARGGLAALHRRGGATPPAEPPEPVPVAVPAQDPAPEVRALAISPLVLTAVRVDVAKRAEVGARPTINLTATRALMDASRIALTSKLVVGGRTVIPGRVAADDQGDPAWVQATRFVEWEQPFSFPLTAGYSYVYQTGTTGLAGAPTVLTPLAVPGVPGVYQETIQGTRIHLVPQAFRLARSPGPPWLPELSMVASDFVEAGADDSVTPVYSVAVAYTLEPWIPADVPQTVARALGRSEHDLTFILTPPASTVLRLQVPGTSGGPAERPDVRVDGGLRITDQLELTPEAFARFVQTLRDAPATGVTGQVQLTLLDGQSTAECQVFLALGFETEDLLDSVYLGAVAGAPGRHRVRLRNRIESAVRVVECRPVPLPGGLAVPAAETVPVDRVLRPLESVEVEYVVEPASCPFLFETLPVRAAPVPDTESLLRMLVVPSGFSTDDVSVAIIAHFLPPEPGGEAVSALKVEFDDESVVELTPESPTATVALSGRLLDAALGRTQPRYFFRVQNVHATGLGAASGWMERDVGAALDVGPVVAKMADSF